MTQGYIAIGYMCNQKCSFCPCSKEEKISDSIFEGIETND